MNTILFKWIINEISDKSNEKLDGFNTIKDLENYLSKKILHLDKIVNIKYEYCGNYESWDNCWYVKNGKNYIGVVKDLDKHLR